MVKQKMKKQQHAWELRPNPTLEKYLNKIPQGKALDIGAGSEKNSLLLAKNGFKIEAIDKSLSLLSKEINNQLS